MTIIDQVLDIFDDFRMDPTPIDEYDSVGKERLKQQMLLYINAGVPIEFRMLGYPFKSNNIRDKVIGTLPDLGEQLSLENFMEFHRRVQEVYTPGVRITLISDGIVFNDIWDISDKTTQDYYEAVTDMPKGGIIKWYNARDFYPKRLSLDEVRNKIVTQWGITPQQLSADIITNPDVNMLYRAFVKFGNLELALNNYPTPTQQQKAAKVWARNTMMRNQAYTNLLNYEFKDYIRLSMHKSINNGDKFSFRLIPGSKIWTSPWHCAILIDKDGEYATIHRKDAVAAGHRLMKVGNKPFYFIEN